MSVSIGTEAPPYEVNSREGDTDEDPEDGLPDSLNHDLGLRKEEAPAV